MIDTIVFLLVSLTIAICGVGCATFLPKILRKHIIAATVWTMITASQTNMLLYRHDANLIGHLTLFVAGWVMVSSWKQLAERGRGENDRQSRRSLATRLFVQTLWGPLALGIGLWVIAVGVERLLDHAMVRRDRATVSVLRACGFHYDNFEYSTVLQELIERQDVIGVRFYLDAGVHIWGDMAPEAVCRHSVTISRMLLMGTKPNDRDDRFLISSKDLLSVAVVAHQTEQVRFLLNEGADPNMNADSCKKSALRIAEQDGDTAMIALLKGAGAKHGPAPQGRGCKMVMMAGRDIELPGKN